MEQVASGLRMPRTLRVAPNGDVFVAESGDDRVRVLRLTNGKVQVNTLFAAGLDLPYGIAFWPPGPQPLYVYIAATDRVVRYPYKVADFVARRSGWFGRQSGWTTRGLAEGWA